jgi:glycosyltransferase involved in cell wall biosynthesis
MNTRSSTLSLLAVPDPTRPSSSSPAKICMHIVGAASADVRAMRAGTALAKAGFDISIIDVESQSTEENREGIRIKHMFVPKAFSATRFKRWSLFRAISLLIRGTLSLVTTSADIYHALDLPALPACYIAAIVRRKPVVFESYELPLSTLPPAEMGMSRRLLQALLALLLRHIIPRCTAVIVVSQPIVEEMRRRYQCSNLSLIRNIAPYQRVVKNDILRQKLGLAAHVRIALYQGYLQPDRGLDTLIQAAPFLEKDTVIVIMGKDKVGMLAELDALIASKGIAERVKIIPAVPYEDLLTWTASADIGLIIYTPDYSQNVQMMLPNKLFEFLTAGVPVLASPLEAVVDIITSYNIGYVVSSLAPASVGAAINAMLADQNALDRMRLNATRAAQEDLNWEKERQKLIQLYHDILKERSVV